MKIKMIMSHQYGSAWIRKDEELLVRRLVTGFLNWDYQCIEGQHSGIKIPFEKFVEIPEEKTYTEKQYTELKQANLMHQENEKVFMRDQETLNEQVERLQRQFKSIDEYAKKKAEQNRILRHDSDLLYGDYKKLQTDNGLMAAALERAMLDHQPVVLPKEVADELQRKRNQGQADYSIVSDIQCEFVNYVPQNYSPMAKFAKRHPSPFLRALADGYTVEQTPEEANEAAFRAGMEVIYKEIDSKYQSQAQNRTELQDRIMQLIKEIYKH